MKTIRYFLLLVLLLPALPLRAQEETELLREKVTLLEEQVVLQEELLGLQQAEIEQQREVIGALLAANKVWRDTVGAGRRTKWQKFKSLVPVLLTATSIAVSASR